HVNELRGNMNEQLFVVDQRRPLRIPPVVGEGVPVEDGVAFVTFLQCVTDKIRLEFVLWILCEADQGLIGKTKEPESLREFERPWIHGFRSEVMHPAIVDAMIHRPNCNIVGGRADTMIAGGGADRGKSGSSFHRIHPGRLRVLEQTSYRGKL